MSMAIIPWQGATSYKNGYIKFTTAKPKNSRIRVSFKTKMMAI
jgi:hypothetical protein